MFKEVNGSYTSIKRTVNYLIKTERINNINKVSWI